jgi:hypothetical protein
MGAGGGYSTELLARVVGSRGAVYAQESAQVMERIKDRFELRAKKPDMKNVVHLIRSYDDPLPQEINGLDLITFFFAYHDVTFTRADGFAGASQRAAEASPAVAWAHLLQGREDRRAVAGRFDDQRRRVRKADQRQCPRRLHAFHRVRGGLARAIELPWRRHAHGGIQRDDGQRHRVRRRGSGEIRPRK